MQREGISLDPVAGMDRNIQNVHTGVLRSRATASNGEDDEVAVTPAGVGKVLANDLASSEPYGDARWEEGKDSAFGGVVGEGGQVRKGVWAAGMEDIGVVRTKLPEVRVVDRAVVNDWHLAGGCTGWVSILPRNGWEVHWFLEIRATKNILK